MDRKNNYVWICLIYFIAIWLCGCTEYSKENNAGVQDIVINSAGVSTELNEVCESYAIDNVDILPLIPDFSEKTYIVINNNIPYFTSEEKECESAFEIYSDLDELGRSGVAYANICTEIMPTEERGAIGKIKPSGWQLVKYDIVDGKYLYNRCHLIGYQLVGENANEKNLITGTRYLTVLLLLGSGLQGFLFSLVSYYEHIDFFIQF